MSVCDDCGINSGCDENCPALLDGDCTVPLEALEVCDIDEEEKAKILELYTV